MTSCEKMFVNSPIQRYCHQIFGLGKFLHKIPSDFPARILEIGSGVGFTTQLLAKKFPKAEITATDFDEDLIKLAQRKKYLNNVYFQQKRSCEPHD